MEGWLEEEDRPSAPWKCTKCDKVDGLLPACPDDNCQQVGLVGTQCTKRDCKAYLHTYHNLTKCPSCKTPLAAQGEAVKRK